MNNTHNTKECRFTDDPYYLDADACEQYRKLKICAFHMQGMCKRPNCDLKHISKAQAIDRGLPPTTRGTIVHPLIIPEEPEISKEVVKNTLWGMEDGEVLNSVISSIVDDDVYDKWCTEETKEMYHALIIY